MNPDEIKQTIERYNKRLEEHGISEKALGWGDKGRSKLRFEILCSEWSLEGATILDYGCGFADLYQYIKDNHAKNFKYIGIDLNPKLIEIAKDKNYSNAEFHVVDSDPEKLLQSLGKIEFIFSSGIFNFKLDDNITYMRSTLDLFDHFAKKGFASNFLSNRVDFIGESNYHSDPTEVLGMHYKYGNNVVLKNNYMPFEFSVFVNKFDPINKTYNIYDSYTKFI